MNFSNNITKKEIDEDTKYSSTIILIKKGQIGYITLFMNLYQHNIKIYDRKANIGYIWNDLTKLWAPTKLGTIEKMCIRKPMNDLFNWCKRRALKELPKLKNVEDRKNMATTIKDLIRSISLIKTNKFSLNLLRDIVNELPLSPDFINNLNKSSHTFPIEGGQIINLMNGNVRERTKNDLFSFECPVKYSEQFDLTEIDEFFLEYIKEKKWLKHFQKILSTTLLNTSKISGNTKGNKYNNIYVFFGDGRNGKSSVIKILMAFLKRGMSYKFDDTNILRKLSNSDNVGDLRPLDKTKLVVIEEYDESGFSSDKDYIVEYVGDKKKNFKLFLITNDLTDVCNNFKEIKNNVVVVPFLKRFTDGGFLRLSDNNIKVDPDKVSDIIDNKKDLIFAWLVKGCIDYCNELKLSNSQGFSDKNNDKNKDGNLLHLPEEMQLNYYL